MPLQFQRQRNIDEDNGDEDDIGCKNDNDRQSKNETEKNVFLPSVWPDPTA